VLVLLLAAPAGASFLPPVRQPRSSEQLAVLHDGVVWVDDGRVLFQSFWSGRVTLGGLESTSPPVLASSGSAVVLVGGARAGFAGGFPPRRLAPVESPGEEAREVAGGDCADWSPLVGSTLRIKSNFAVGQGELIDAGECQVENGGFEEQELATSQPLFVHNLGGGEWHVLRWVKGHDPPVLATEGHLLAIGEPVSAMTMRVTVLDLATRKILARFQTPPGYLSFASARRLVLSVPVREVATSAHAAEAIRRVERVAVYRLDLYTLHGSLLAYLGSVVGLPLVSHMHLLESEAVDGAEILAARNLLDGSRRRLIGFDGPPRSLDAVGFRWPAVAIVETTRAPLAQSEVTCESGEYHPAGPPQLRIFDLARREPYVQPLPVPHLAPPPGRCPPRPVYVGGAG
jgi:hypothetical protein